MATIADRIRNLNLSEVNRQPGTGPIPLTAGKKPPPPLPPRLPPRSKSTVTLQQEYEDDGTNPRVGNQPNGPEFPPAPVRPEQKKLPPPVLASRKASPQPPPRRPSEMSLARTNSQESVASLGNASVISGTSDYSVKTTATSASRKSSMGSTFRVPTYDPASLPPLPPKKSDQKRPSVLQSNSTPKVPILPRQNSQPQPQLQPQSQLQLQQTQSNRAPPPPLPVRRETNTTQELSVIQPLPSKSQTSHDDRAQPVQAPTLPRQSAIAYGLNKATEKAPTIPQRPQAEFQEQPQPPSIPLASRPNLSQLQASKPKPVSSYTNPTYLTPSSPSACMVCRDFSAADAHAARFPRQSLPSTDTAWLSEQLTANFTSKTDKARVIFTWLHHNVAYDTVAFYSGNRKPANPATTMASGLAVCAGYASLFTALATHAGLESIVIGGHGKGIGHRALQANDPIPPYESNHAWNAVKLDDGAWKLIESCWGAGYIDDNQQYVKHFNPGHFIMSNEEFGRKHYPEDRNHFFRSDGTVPSWEEYSIGDEGPGEEVQVYSPCSTEHSINPKSVTPRKKHIRVRQNGTRIQFQMEKLCEHFDLEKNGKGKPYVYVLQVGGKDGRNRDYVPFETNGRFWYTDVAAEELGCAGQSVFLYAVTTIAGKPGRGISVAEFKAAKGRRAMSFEAVASWQLV